MARLVYDVADASVARLFPAHGWAVNSQGVKILWCPLMRLLVSPEATRLRKGVSQTLPAGTNLNALPLMEHLRKLAIDLRELHTVVRVACDLPGDLEPETLMVDLRAFEMVPLYLDLAFVYLRRIADLLAMACRPLLFEYWQQVPREFKRWVADVDCLKSYRPLCDFVVLREAVLGNSAWFTTLRGRSPATGKKGIRDALEHRGVRLIVGKQRSGQRRPRFTVLVDSREEDVEIRKDILSLVPEAIGGLCGLMSGIHSAIDVSGQYDMGDVLSLPGTDDDIVGYWPKIGA